MCAAAPAAMIQPLLVVPDWIEGDLVYQIGLESVPSAADSDEPPSLEVRPFPRPIARFPIISLDRSSTLAVSGGGCILAVTDGSCDTLVIHDTATHSAAPAPGPQLRDAKQRPAVLPVGDDTVVVMDTTLRRGGASCCFEALRRLPGGGGWCVDPLPAPPPVAHLDVGGGRETATLHITAYFAMGASAWISVAGEGTFPLDTERGGAWREEGSWELPFHGRAVFVPELGSVVGVGFGRGFLGRDVCQVRALDVEAGRPPVLRHVWEELCPPECEYASPIPWRYTVSLVYLGNGRFCLTWPGDVKLHRNDVTRRASYFTVPEVRWLAGGEIQVTERGKVHRHVWPIGQYSHPYFLQSA